MVKVPLVSINQPLSRAIDCKNAQLGGGRRNYGGTLQAPAEALSISTAFLACACSNPVVKPPPTKCKIAKTYVEELSDPNPEKQKHERSHDQHHRY
jgi:hypothetical protein